MLNEKSFTWAVMAKVGFFEKTMAFCLKNKKMLYF